MGYEIPAGWGMVQAHPDTIASPRRRPAGR